MRTYAKDFAALSGQAPETAAHVAPAPTSRPEPTKQNQTSTEDGVTVTEFDSSPVNHKDGVSSKDFAQEVVDLKDSDSDGIFQGQKTASDAVAAAVSSMPLMPQGSIAAVPQVPQEPTGPIPSPVPTESVSIPTPLPQAESEPDRQAILARLRAKVSAERAVQATAPATTEAPIRAAAPDFSHTPEPVLPIPQVSKEPLPASAAKTVSDSSSPLHTYSSDFADHIDAAGGTTFSVLAAQSDAGQTPKRVRPKRSFAPLLAGAAMLLIGIGAVVGAYVFTKQGSVISTTTNVPSVIPYDESVEVKGTGQALMQAISDVAQGGSIQGNVVVTYVTLATSTGTGIPQPGGELIQDLGLTAPSILMRNINTSSTVGIVRAGSESRPFMILKVNSYERTFAGMLAWEPAMAQDLATFYPSYADSGSLSTSTSSSSPAVNGPAPTTFTDAVVSNYDVRVLRDSAGRSRMLYGYRGKDTLIIARDEASFTTLVSRLSSAGN